MRRNSDDLRNLLRCLTQRKDMFSADLTRCVEKDVSLKGDIEACLSKVELSADDPQLHSALLRRVGTLGQERIENTRLFASLREEVNKLAAISKLIERKISDMSDTEARLKQRQAMARVLDSVASLNNLS